MDLRPSSVSQERKYRKDRLAIRIVQKQTILNRATRNRDKNVAFQSHVADTALNGFELPARANFHIAQEQNFFD
jgi:hypothetical protein